MAVFLRIFRFAWTKLVLCQSFLPYR